MPFEVVSALVQRGEREIICCDGTVGAGGHAAAIVEAIADVDAKAWIIGCDVDAEMLKLARQKLHDFQLKGHRIDLFQESYAALPARLQSLGLQARGVDAILLDLGVSSVHFDQAARGFSFGQEGPLDMRLDQREAETARTFLQRTPEADLAALIKRLGEEPRARAVARSIKQRLLSGPLETTTDLADCIRRVVHKRPGSRIDPATKTFQAIRIAVNRELEHLETFLAAMPKPLRVGGRVGIISFHSLEDRLVKTRFRELAYPCICPPDLPICHCGRQAEVQLTTKKAIQASAEEIQKNPRSRSAKFRVAERIEA